MKRTIMLFLFAFLVHGCQKQAPTGVSRENTPDHQITEALEKMASTNWQLIYSTNGGVGQISPGNSSGWIPFEEFGARVATYQIKFHVFRNVLQPIQGNGTNDFIEARVENCNNILMLNETYHLSEPAVWYDFLEVVSNSGGGSEMIIDVPPTFRDALIAEVYIRPHTYKAIGGVD